MFMGSDRTGVLEFPCGIERRKSGNTLIADAGSGLFYWISWLYNLDKGDPRAYTYDYGNVFLYVAGLLNMLVVVDVFDIAMGRKQ